MRKLFPALAVLVVIAHSAVSAQEPAAYLSVFEPIEWATDAGTVTVRAGTLMRVRGLAFHPGGIREITIAGEPATREQDPSGATTFTGYVSAAGGLREVEVVLEPVTGERMRKVFAITVEGGAPIPGPADRERAAAAPTRRYSPAGALVGGLVIPGFGQFYTGRPARGLIHLLGAGAAVGASFVLSEPGRLECNEFDECREVEARRDLTPFGIAAAGAISVLGAVEGFSFARRYAAAAEPGTRRDARAPSAPTLHPPALSAAGPGIRLELLRITH
jgi:hypothetical protein